VVSVTDRFSRPEPLLFLASNSSVVLTRLSEPHKNTIVTGIVGLLIMKLRARYSGSAGFRGFTAMKSPFQSYR
jgi:hypothetical protein